MCRVILIQGLTTGNIPRYSFVILNKDKDEDPRIIIGFTKCTGT